MRPCRAVARESLIPQTLEEMETDDELKKYMADLQQVGQAALTRAERLERQRALDRFNLPSFASTCKVRGPSDESASSPCYLAHKAMRMHAQDRGVSPLVRSPTKILQLNIGLYCNQACTHCHVESSPKR
jgi:hypothetical protein